MLLTLVWCAPSYSSVTKEEIVLFFFCVPKNVFILPTTTKKKTQRKVFFLRKRIVQKRSREVAEKNFFHISDHSYSSADTSLYRIECVVLVNVGRIPVFFCRRKEGIITHRKIPLPNFLLLPLFLKKKIFFIYQEKTEARERSRKENDTSQFPT